MINVALSALLWAAQAASQPAAPDNFRIEDRVDPMTDARELQGILSGEGGAMVLMCSPGMRPILVFQPRGFLGGRINGYEWRDFTYRVDANAPVSTRWKYSDQLAVAPGNSEARALLSAALGGSVLRVRAVSFDGSFVDGTFQIAPVRERLQTYVQRCAL